jgi:hypothetical protein
MRAERADCFSSGVSAAGTSRSAGSNPGARAALLEQYRSSTDFWELLEHPSRARARCELGTGRSHETISFFFCSFSAFPSRHFFEALNEAPL